MDTHTPPTSTSLAPHWQRRVGVSPGVIDRAAVQRHYDRTAGWALQRSTRHSALLARSVIAAPDGTASPLLLARAVSTAGLEDEAASVAGSVGASPVRATASDGAAAGADPHTPPLTTQLQRRFDAAGTVQPHMSKLLERTNRSVAQPAALLERLAARALPLSAVLPSARTHGSSVPDTGTAAREMNVAWFPQVDGASHGKAASHAHGTPHNDVAERSVSAPLVVARVADLPGATVGRSSPRQDAPRSDAAHVNRSAGNDVAERSVSAPLVVARVADLPGATVGRSSPRQDAPRSDAAHVNRSAAAVMTLARPALAGSELAVVQAPSTALPATAELRRTTTRDKPVGVPLPTEADEHVRSATVSRSSAPALSAGLVATPLALAAVHSSVAASPASTGSNALPLAGSTPLRSPLAAVSTLPSIIARASEIASGSAPPPALVWRRAALAVTPAAANPAQASVVRRGADGAPAGAAPVSTSSVEPAPGAANLASPAARAGMPDLNQLAEQVTRIIARRLEVERERRGGKRWN